MKKLTDIEKQNNFNVPEKYFESFSDKLNERINLEASKKEQSYKTVFQIFKPYMYMAACILILITGLRAFLEKVVEEPKETTHSNINTFNNDDYINDVLAVIHDDRLAIYEYFEEITSNSDPEAEEDEIDFIEDYLLQYNIIEEELFYE
jgi:hypothetical protein